MAHQSTKRACWKCGQQVTHYSRMHWRPKYRLVKDELKYYIDSGGNKIGYWTKKKLPAYETPTINSDKMNQVLVPVKHYVYINKRFVLCKGSESLN